MGKPLENHGELKLVFWVSCCFVFDPTIDGRFHVLTMLLLPRHLRRFHRSSRYAVGFNGLNWFLMLHLSQNWWVVIQKHVIVPVSDP